MPQRPMGVLDWLKANETLNLNGCFTDLEKGCCFQMPGANPVKVVFYK